MFRQGFSRGGGGKLSLDDRALAGVQGLQPRIDGVVEPDAVCGLGWGLGFTASLMSRACSSHQKACINSPA